MYPVGLGKIFFIFFEYKINVTKTEKNGTKKELEKMF